MKGSVVKFNIAKHHGISGCPKIEMQEIKRKKAITN